MHVFALQTWWHSRLFCLCQSTMWDKARQSGRKSRKAYKHKHTMKRQSRQRMMKCTLKHHLLFLSPPECQLVLQYSRTPLIRPPSESHWCGRIRGMVAREGFVYEQKPLSVTRNVVVWEGWSLVRVVVRQGFYCTPNRVTHKIIEIDTWHNQCEILKRSWMF